MSKTIPGPALTVIPLTYQYRGTVGSNVANAIGAAMIACFTLGLGVPWAKAKRLRYVAEHTYINGHRMGFTGTGGALWGQYIKWWLLCIPTIGIYSFVISSRLRKWAIEHQTCQLPA